MNFSKLKKKLDEIGNELDEGITSITTPLVGILTIGAGIAYFFGIIDIPLISLSLLLVGAGLLILLLNFKLRGFTIPKMPKLRKEQIHGAIMFIIAAGAINLLAFFLRGNLSVLSLALAGVVALFGLLILRRR